MKDNLQLLEAEEYYKALLKGVPKAKKRIVIAAMIVLWGERTAPIFLMLQDALKRGVKVTILLDNYTRLAFLYGLQPRSERGQLIRQTFKMLEDLGGLGAKVYCYGKIGLIPFKGRCHLKISVIDDTSYSFGGINFHDQPFDFKDYMLVCKNPDMADCLGQLVDKVGQHNPPLVDGEVRISKEARVLFDGGLAKRSLIYERACELSARAKKVHYFSQMTPSGQLARLLSETDTTFYFNRPEQMISPISWGQAFDEQRYRIKNSYEGKEFIHAKFMLFELEGGKKALLSGSHNFSYRGVSFGTQEVELYSEDTALWDQLFRFMKRNVRVSRQAT
jgi:phosphatidylserine/phosphatidylglycerophosphate/cardiolipin synthase-like enzyme